jgi:hypothetical protein
MPRFRRMFFSWLGLAALLGAIVAPSQVVADAISTWTAGPGAILDNTYAGFVDAPTANGSVPTGNFQVRGWFVDMNAQGWAGADDVQVFQGTMDGGGKMLAKASFAQGRPDVAAATGNPYWAASGFNATVPGGSLSPGATTLSVYVHTPGKGWWYKQVNVTVSSSAAGAPAPAAVPAPAGAAAPAPSVSGSSLPIVGFEKPKDSEQVLTKSDYEIVGYALDRAAQPNQGVAGSGIDRVQVYIGGERENNGTYLGDATLAYSDSVPASLYGGQFISSGWRLTFKPTQFHPNTFLLFAYARSAVSGKEDVATRYFSIHD